MPKLELEKIYNFAGKSFKQMPNERYAFVVRAVYRETYSGEFYTSPEGISGFVLKMQDITPKNIKSLRRQAILRGRKKFRSVYNCNPDWNVFEVLEEYVLKVIWV